MSKVRLKLLVIEDDDLSAEALRLAVPPHWDVLRATNGIEFPAQAFHAAFVDLHLSGRFDQSEGLAALKNLARLRPGAELIAMSGDLRRDLMEESLKAGATRFLAKPFSQPEVVQVLQKIEALFDLQTRAVQCQTNAWMGSGPASRQVRRQIAGLRGNPGPILIQGESGTGKEVAATLLHSQEGDRPWVPVHVSGISESLFDSEFFGHVKGSFTGADQTRMGLAEMAHKGDLFLDEIEALTPTAQVKLLRFLENGEVRRVGAKDAIRVEVRVLAATNQDLETLVRQNKFREDLYWRLNGQRLLLPPLRERLEDLPELTKYFLDQDPIRTLVAEPEAIQRLQLHSWPGNVRELKRVIERLRLSAPLPFVRTEDVDQQLATPQSLGSALRDQELRWEVGLDGLLSQHEAILIQKALETKKEIDDAAKLLQISRSSLYKKIKDYGIPMGGFR